MAVTPVSGDVAFARAVGAAIAGEANVDLYRVYATGLSNGGAFSQRLACEAADVFAAAAPMAFPIAFASLTDCQPSRYSPLPVSPIPWFRTPAARSSWVGPW